MCVSAYLQVNSPASISLPIRLCKLINSFLTLPVSSWIIFSFAKSYVKNFNSLTYAGLILLLVKAVTLLWTENILKKSKLNWTLEISKMVTVCEWPAPRHKLKTNVSIWCLYIPCTRVHVVKCVQRGFYPEEKVTTSRAWWWPVLRIFAGKLLHDSWSWR